jgi:hypothetical protein
MRRGLEARILAAVLAVGISPCFSAADAVSDATPSTQPSSPSATASIPNVTAEATPSSVAANTARVALNIQMPEVKFNNVGLADALDFFRDATGANFNVDWKSLEMVNIDKGTPVSLTLHSVSMGKALELALAQASPNNLLTYYVDDNVVEVTTQSNADSKMITVVYDVEDLIALDDSFNPAASSGSSISLSGGGGGGGGGGSSSAISSSSNNSSGGGAGGTGKDAKTDKLIKLIETTVRPEIWKDNDQGGNATISVFNDKLIVTAPRSVQEAINGPID